MTTFWDNKTSFLKWRKLDVWNRFGQREDWKLNVIQEIEDALSHDVKNMLFKKHWFFSKNKLLWNKMKNPLEYFENILFFKMESSKLFDYSTNLGWSCLLYYDTMLKIYLLIH